MLLKKTKIFDQKTFIERISEILQDREIKIEFNKSVQIGGHFNFFLPQEKQYGHGGTISRFSLIQLPGCCGIIVSTNASISERFRKKGLGKLFCEMRSHIAFEAGYSLMLCTDIVSNEPQQKILGKVGWEKHLEFLNSRTGNKIALHTIQPQISKMYQLGFEIPLQYIK